MADNTRHLALRRGMLLEEFSLAWMAIEAIAAIAAGAAARSLLLTAFGADSVIELLSGVVVLQWLRVEERGGNADRVEQVEVRATKISAVLLVLLCVYVVISAIVGIGLRIRPDFSVLGVGISAAAVVVMPLLAVGKRAANKTLQSPALRADVAESVSCAYLAAITLGGLAASAITGWWWVQYIASMALLWWLVPEAREAIEGAQSGSERTHNH